MDIVKFMEKVLKEYDDISFRIQELSDYIAKVDKYEIDISEVQDYNLLVAQLSAMKTYQLILFERISNF